VKNSLKQFWHSTMNPDLYHGHGKSPPFFEGWYFKLVDRAENQRYAVIPGVFLGEDEHAFVQVLNGSTAQSTYHRFPISKFWASEKRFEIRIGENVFFQNSIELNIEDHLGQIHGKLDFDGMTPWPVSFVSPGIMGWYAWVPKMECYHGVLSLDHTIIGELQVGAVSVDFSGGRGYIEKDWGQSFPAGYVWLQSNHFRSVGSSLTASIALIPWLGSTFRGFIIGLWHKEVLYRFATYTGAKTETLHIADDHLMWVIQDRRYRLEIRARRAEGGILREPTRSEMLQRVEETMSASVDVRLSNRAGKTIFSEKGRNTALEVNGDINQLLRMK
jgi:tocopherol cyclase